MLALRPGGAGDVTTSHKAWSFDLGPDVPTPISDGKLLYVVRDNGVVHALDVKTGADRLGSGTAQDRGLQFVARPRRRQAVCHERERGADVGLHGRSRSSNSLPRIRSTTTASRRPRCRTARSSSAPTSSSGRSARATTVQRTSFIRGASPPGAPLHALSRAASSARSVRVAHSRRSFAMSVYEIAPRLNPTAVFVVRAPRASHASGAGRRGSPRASV